jgi:hypothetical protein
MQTVTLSANAVAVLRFEVRGWKAKNPAGRLPAYRELAAAGIMEAVPGSEGEYRFTGEGLDHGAAILAREAERIEQERYEPPDPSRLSHAARELLRRRLAGDQDVTDANRPLYRELAAARIMVPCHTFIGGWESAFKFTYWGWKRRFEFAGMNYGEEDIEPGSQPNCPASPSPSPAESPAPGR